MDQCVFKNLAWSGVYLGRTLLNNIIQKFLALVLLTETGPEVYVATIIIFIYNSYGALE